MSTANRQLNLPPVPFQNSEGDDIVFRKTEDIDKDAAYALSAELFNEACGDPERGGLTRSEERRVGKVSDTV